jgi:hypothetical protein
MHGGWCAVIWTEEHEPSKKVAGRAVAGAILLMVKKILRDDMLNMPLERISVEPHIHLS